MNRLPRVTTAGLAMTLIFMTAGCATVPKDFETPKLNLVSIQLLNAGFLEQRYGVRLRVQNPNAFMLPIEGMSYELKLAGNSFASGVTPEAFNVPKFGETEFDVEIRTNLLKSARELARWYSSGSESLDYELGGKLDIGLSFLKHTVPFSETGSISLTRP